MEKIKTFLQKYKNELLIALGAVTAIATSIATMDEKSAVFSSIVIAIVAVLVEVLKNGVTENALTLLSKAILIIIEEIKKLDAKDDTPVWVSAQNNVAVDLSNKTKTTENWEIGVKIYLTVSN